VVTTDPSSSAQGYATLRSLVKGKNEPREVVKRGALAVQVAPRLKRLESSGPLKRKGRKRTDLHCVSRKAKRVGGDKRRTGIHTVRAIRANRRATAQSASMQVVAKTSISANSNLDDNDTGYASCFRSAVQWGGEQ
jgi:hypothetical protein